MTTGRGTVEGADGAWADIRADGDIQFAPIAPDPPSEPPAWLEALGRWLGSLFEPLARGLGAGWPILKWVLVASAAAMLAWLLWRVFEPYFSSQATTEDTADTWQPDREEALALLEDADRLAAAGDYDGAVHLLLNRSVGQIARARPDLVVPSSTARELSRQEALPVAARGAFGIIATAVERSLFALQRLGLDDWQAARGAYSAFALERLR